MTNVKYIIIFKNSILFTYFIKVNATIYEISAIFCDPL